MTFAGQQLHRAYPSYYIVWWAWISYVMIIAPLLNGLRVKEGLSSFWTPGEQLLAKWDGLEKGIDEELSLTQLRWFCSSWLTVVLTKTVSTKHAICMNKKRQLFDWWNASIMFWLNGSGVASHIIVEFFQWFVVQFKWRQLITRNYIKSLRQCGAL